MAVVDNTLVISILTAAMAIVSGQSDVQLLLAENARTTNDLQYVLGSSYRLYVAAYWRYLSGTCEVLGSKLSTDVAMGYLHSYCPYLNQCPVVSSGQSCMVQKSVLAIRKACCRESNCRYGTVFPSPKIFGGQPTFQNEFPWMCMLLVDGYFTCGCTIVDKTHVLTAAHCFTWPNADQKIEILAGRYQLNLSKTEEGNQRVMVKSYQLHEQFDFKAMSNDIAMLTLATPLIFTSSVTPVCLPVREDKLEQRCTVIGWGVVNKQLERPEFLMKVDLNTYNRTECLNTFKDTSLPSGDLARYLLPGTLCAANGFLGVKDSCWGDSGGPLMCIKMTAGVPRYYFMGIVSNSAYCGKAGEPGIYTDIVYYLDWVESNLTSR